MNDHLCVDWFFYQRPLRTHYSSTYLHCLRVSFSLTRPLSIIHPRTPTTPSPIQSVVPAHTTHAELKPRES